MDLVERQERLKAGLQLGKRFDVLKTEYATLAEEVKNIRNKLSSTLSKMDDRKIYFIEGQFVRVHWDANTSTWRVIVLEVETV